MTGPDVHGTVEQEIAAFHASGPITVAVARLKTDSARSEDLDAVRGFVAAHRGTRLAEALRSMYPWLAYEGNDGERSAVHRAFLLRDAVESLEGRQRGGHRAVLVLAEGDPWVSPDTPAGTPIRVRIAGPSEEPPRDPENPNLVVTELHRRPGGDLPRTTVVPLDRLDVPDRGMRGEG